MTRQWLSPPELMCRKHLLGEHFETHIFVSKMEKEWKMDGFIRGSMFFGAEFIKERHDLLASFLSGHKTPLTIGHINKDLYPRLEVKQDNMLKSMLDLVTRCEECKFKHMKWVGESHG